LRRTGNGRLSDFLLPPFTSAGGVDVLAYLNISLLIEHTDMHFYGMKINSAILLVLVGIKIHQMAFLWLKV
jgi:hypothetical protein